MRPAHLTGEIATMSQLKTVEQLRNVLPAPRETTKAKVLPFLDDQAIDFLRTCPFGLMATVGRDGPIEVSPKATNPGSSTSKTNERFCCPNGPATTSPSACRTSSRPAGSA
jgi:hypothetical protein